MNTSKIVIVDGVIAICLWAAEIEARFNIPEGANMSERQLNKDEMARYYALRHLKTDPGTQEILYLPKQAPEREIRFLEINNMIAVRDKDPLEPLDFGIDAGGAVPHTLMVVDVTPAQWEKIRMKELELPSGWSLDEATHFTRSSQS